MHAFRRIRRPVAAIVLVLYLPACHHWVQPEGVAPQEYVAKKQPDKVRLTVNDLAHGLYRLELLTPSLGPGDSLTGLPRGGAAPVTVAWSTIERFEVRESDPSGTTGAVLGGLAVVGVGVLIAVLLIGRGVACAYSGGC